jgi:hypothetical protein
MDRRVLIGVGLALLGTASCQTKPLGSGNPLFVVKGQSPWRMALGSESPTFALYDDGNAIFQREEGFKSVTLDRRELSRLVNKLGLAELPKFAKHYAVASYTDANTHIFYVFGSPKPSVISVYGELRVRALEMDGKPVNKLVSMVPEPLITAYDVANAFDHPKATSWLPEKVEVYVWPYEYAPEPSIHWPETWPGLKDPATEKRGDGYSLYVPSKELPALQRFLETETEKGAVEIGGKKWAASVRYPFPKERLWESLAPPLTS